ncbi:MAG: hypothetical protein V7K42_06400 [Nostoc sp.]
MWKLHPLEKRYQQPFADNQSLRQKQEVILDDAVVALAWHPDKQYFHQHR